MWEWERIEWRDRQTQSRKCKVPWFCIRTLETVCYQICSVWNFLLNDPWYCFINILGRMSRKVLFWYSAMYSRDCKFICSALYLFFIYVHRFLYQLRSDFENPFCNITLLWRSNFHQTEIWWGDIQGIPTFWLFSYVFSPI